MSQESQDSGDTVDSVFRIMGIDNRGLGLVLYDIHHGNTVWVSLTGYDDEIQLVLDRAQFGNLIEAELASPNDDSDYWNILDVDFLRDTNLFYFETRDFTHGPTDELWEKIQELDGFSYSIGWPKEQPYEYVINLRPNIEQTENGSFNRFESHKRGELPVEEYFEGEEYQLQDGAHSVLLCNPNSKDYLVYYIFPDQNEQYDNIYARLYDASH
jgi:hypothetical protein